VVLVEMQQADSSHKQMPTETVASTVVNSQTGLVMQLVVVQEELVVVSDHLHTNHQAFQQEVLVELEVLMPDLVLEALHHSKHQVLVSKVVLSAVVLVVASNHHHLNHHQLVVLALMLQQSVKLLATQLKPTQLGPNMVLKYEVLVSMSMPTHKLYVDQLQVVFKPIHKTLKSAFFNHHPFHHQAHSSSKKCAHPSHQHHPHFASDNKLQLFLNLPHSFFVKDHHKSQLQLLPKQLSATLLLYPFHHDQSSLNVSQLLQPAHVISSSNVGFLMEHKPNEKPLFKKLQQLLVIKHHAMLLSNMKLFKSVLSDNSNALVLPNITHKLTFNNTVLHFLMLLHSFNKLVLLVLLKIFHHQLVLLALVHHQHHLVKMHHSVPVVLVELDLLLVEI
jgi:hypothetical protein